MDIDKLMFFLGFFFLLLFFLKKKATRTSYLLLGIAVSLIVIGYFLPKEIFGKWNAIKKLNNRNVDNIVLRPSQPAWDVNLINYPLTISKKETIDSLLKLLKNSSAFIPSHPIRIWEINMILNVEHGDSLILKIEKTQNNGAAVFSFNDKFRNDELASYLEKIVDYKSK